MAKCTVLHVPIPLFTCGMYPTMLPGTLWPLAPGWSPNTITWPLSTCKRPITHRSRVVLPQPLGPSKPYLTYKKNLYILTKVFTKNQNLAVLYNYDGFTIPVSILDGQIKKKVTNIIIIKIKTVDSDHNHFFRS